MALKDRLALKSLLFILLALVVGLLLTGGPPLLRAGGLLIPLPEKTAEQLVGALAAHRTEGALNQLSQDLQQQTDHQQLRELIARIEQHHQGIEQASGKQSRIEGNRASADVEVKLKDGQTMGLSFPLVREQGIWRIDSLQPLEQLAGGG